MSQVDNVVLTKCKINIHKPFHYNHNKHRHLTTLTKVAAAEDFNIGECHCNFHNTRFY